jgi:hypothetical protein
MTSILSSERKLYKDYGRRYSIGKKIVWPWVWRGLAPRRTDWRQPVSRKVTLTLTLWRDQVQNRSRVYSSNSRQWRVDSGESSFEMPAWEQNNWIELSFRNWQLQNNGNKGIRMWKEDFMCDLKWQWDCYKSVARIRLENTENCKSVIALYCLQSRVVWMGVSMNPIIQSKTLFVRDPARDNTNGPSFVCFLSFFNSFFVIIICIYFI